MRTVCLAFCLAIVATHARLRAAEPLTAEMQENRVLLVHGSGAKRTVIGEYGFQDKTVLRPFFANLKTTEGIQVTRNFPPKEGVDAVDHADMHPGVWLAFGVVAGEDYWRNKATIKHERFIESPVSVKEGLSFATESTMISSTQVRQANLICRYLVTLGEHDWRIRWTAEITPQIDGFYLGDQEEMGLGARVATAITEKKGGQITNSHGVTTAKKTWGQPAAWCDYSGVIDNRHVGIAIVADASSTTPTWWHNRDYGVFVANAFGRKSLKQGDENRVNVARGETLRLAYTIIVHSSDKSDFPSLEQLVK